MGHGEELCITFLSFLANEKYFIDISRVKGWYRLFKNLIVWQNILLRHATELIYFTIIPTYRLIYNIDFICIYM